MFFSSEIKLYSEISIYKLFHNIFAFFFLDRAASSEASSPSENIERFFFYPRLISERKCGLAKSKLYSSHLKQKITKCAFLTDLY